MSISFRMLPTMGTQIRGAGMRRSRRRLHGVLFVALCVIALILLAPMAWLLISALKRWGELSTWPVRWWPAKIQGVNFSEALRQIPYLPMAMNSVLLSTISGLLTIASSALCGYGFARLYGRGQAIALYSHRDDDDTPIITPIPTYLMFSRVNLVGLIGRGCCKICAVGQAPSFPSGKRFPPFLANWRKPQFWKGQGICGSSPRSSCL
jgi:multiple sugar transport system permease protein